MPKVRLLQSAVMVNLLGQHLQPAKEVLPEHTEWHFHDYGKAESKNNRKMGHITILSDDLRETKSSVEKNSIWDV